MRESSEAASSSKLVGASVVPGLFVQSQAWLLEQFLARSNRLALDQVAYFFGLLPEQTLLLQFSLLSLGLPFVFMPF